jgi:bifunctional DNA-binding transcriptional regulator/antitoxin component of YhaV-PrlF toxin-antitoxin module
MNLLCRLGCARRLSKDSILVRVSKDMAKVTSKLQVTMPKALAARYGISPGDDIDWEAAGDVIRVVPSRKRPARDVGGRLRLFDQATVRQQKRDEAASVAPDKDRGWSRDDLYDRGRAR